MEPGTEAHFTPPFRQIVLILLVIGLVGAGGFFVLPRLMPVFLSNPYLNGFILFVFVFGVFACFWQVYQIFTSVSWIEGFAAENPGHKFVKAPRLLAPLAALLRARGARKNIGASSARSILDSVATRIDEDRDITRYIVNLLIFLGLLGTFFGLATTIPAVVDTIRSLAPQEGEGGVEVFSRLMTGLEAQLGGMGTAFSSSLLGLAGALIVGLLELFANHGQNRFYRELEEWLSTITRLGFAPNDPDGDGEVFSPALLGAGPDMAAASAIITHMSEQMESLQNLFTQSDVSRAMVDERLGTLANSVERLTQRLEDEGVSTPVLLRIADGQERMIAALEARAEDTDDGAHTDAESRMRLRSIDVQLLRILEEMSAGRQESQAELRADIAALTKAVRQMSNGKRG
ncbi:MAG TPA: biopolymer transporter ExbB [Aliiroseovarius sp.]|nr:biopolymer transporter ExbB [Aliiroseovarius sp.]